MPVPETIRSELTSAMKSGDTGRRDIMRLLLAALNNARIEARRELADTEAIAVLQREARQRHDSIEAYEQGAREDLAAAEREELGMISSLLPAGLSTEQLEALAREVIAELGASGAGDLGKVMRPLMERVAGRADGRGVNQLVRELLGAS